MSAICGIVSLREPSIASGGRLEPVLQAIAHRGGRAERRFFDPVGVALGLASSGAFRAPGETDAPAWYEDDDLVVALDGYVHNAGTILGGEAGRYENRSVGAVVELLKRDHAGFPKGLEGPFCLAVWERRTQALTLVADTLGSRPLYYYVDSARGLVLFSTVLTALLEHPALPRAIDPKGLQLYLYEGGIVPPYSLLEGVRKLMPAECLTIDAAGVLGSRRYWQAADVETGPEALSYWTPRVREQVDAAVRRVSRSTPRLGLFFSGGAESAAMGASLAQAQDIETVALTAAYVEDKSDDPYWGEQIARHLGLRQLQLQIGPADVTPTLLAKLMRAFDEPSESAARAVTTHLLSEAAKAEGLDSCLAGNFGEFLFGGNPTWLTAQRRLRDGETTEAAQLDGFLLEGDYFTPEQVDKLMREPAGDLIETMRGLAESYGALVPAADLHDRIVGTYYVQTGNGIAISFAHRVPPLSDVELLSPFHDLPLFEFARTIPSRLKGGATIQESKRLLLGAYASDLPPGAIERRKQVYPALPWYRGAFKHLEPMVMRGVESLKSTGLLRRPS